MQTGPQGEWTAATPSCGLLLFQGKGRSMLCGSADTCCFAIPRLSYLLTVSYKYPIWIVSSSLDGWLHSYMLSQTLAVLLPHDILQVARHWLFYFLITYYKYPAQVKGSSLDCCMFKWSDWRVGWMWP